MWHCNHRQICFQLPASDKKTSNLTSEILARSLVRLTPGKLKCLEKHLFQVALAQVFLHAVQFSTCQYNSINVPSSYFIHPPMKLYNLSNCKVNTSICLPGFFKLNLKNSKWFFSKYMPENCANWASELVPFNYITFVFLQHWNDLQIRLFVDTEINVSDFTSFVVILSILHEKMVHYSFNLILCTGAKIWMC